MTSYTSSNMDLRVFGPFVLEALEDASLEFKFILQETDGNSLGTTVQSVRKVLDNVEAARLCLAHRIRNCVIVADDNQTDLTRSNTMKKIVINKCFGGFSLSYSALMWLHARGADVAMDAKEYFGEAEPDRYIKELADFKNNGARFLGTLFTPEGGKVLSTYPRIARDDPLLVECVEILGKDANGHCASLGIVEIPDDVSWEIDEYDGNESVVEKHRSWS